MSGQKIIITIKDGNLNVEAEGYQGEGCDDATRFLEELGKLKSVRRKPEFRRQQVQVNRTRIIE